MFRIGGNDSPSPTYACPPRIDLYRTIRSMNMKLMLELMLFALATILRRNSTKLIVQAKLRDQRHTVEVRTADGSVARSFVFCGGSIFSQRGMLASPDVSLVWKNPAVA